MNLAPSSKGLMRRYGWFAVFWILIAIPVVWTNRYYPGREAEGPIWTDAMRQKIFLEMPTYVMLFYAAWVTISARNQASQRLESRRELAGLPHADITGIPHEQAWT